jgi:hypothetical protein
LSLREFICTANLGELAVEIRLSRALEFVGGEYPVIDASPIECVSRIARKNHIEIKVSSDTRGGLAAVVGSDPAHRDAAHLAFAEPCSEIMRSVESRVMPILEVPSARTTSSRVGSCCTGAARSKGVQRSWRAHGSANVRPGRTDFGPAVPIPGQHAGVRTVNVA